MVGQNSRVKLYHLVGDDTHGSKEVLERKAVISSEHIDFVSCIVSCEGRFYSAGYDRKIVIYDVPHQRDLKLKPVNVIRDAHEASITCMIYGKDADNSWLITGSIDRVVKLWSLDGSLIQRFDGFRLYNPKIVIPLVHYVMLFPLKPCGLQPLHQFQQYLTLEAVSMYQNLFKLMMIDFILKAWHWHLRAYILFQKPTKL
jgi:WD40 repeat protein